MVRCSGFVVRDSGLVGLIFLLLLVVSEAAGAVTAVDDRGRQVMLDAPARRIVSLAPHATELLYAVGAGDDIVGAVEYSDYPDAARAIPRIGDAMRIDLERVLALRPDLVVAWQSGNAPADIERLEGYGIAVFVTEARVLADIPGQLIQLGELTATAELAGQAAQHYRQRLQALNERYAGQRPVSVFYQIWERPLMTVSGRHIISDAIRLCGGRNIFAGLAMIAPTVSREAVVAADPDVILSGLFEDDQRALNAWRQWPQMKAVRRGNLFAVPAESMSRPTPRMLEGMESLCQSLQKARNRLAR